MLKDIFAVFICTWSILTVTANSSLIDGSTTQASSEIIGSSVVTSVSVVLGNEHDMQETTEYLQAHKVQPVLLTIEKLDGNDDTSISSNGLRSLVPPKNQSTPQSQKKALRKEAGVQGVIDTLKNIVQEEQQKHTTTNTNVVQPVDETPPTVVVEKVTNKFVPGSTISGEDDDEMEAGTSDPIPPTTDAIDDFAKHVVSMVPEVEEQDNENDTATSAEVHDAIHKISGAILSFDDGEKVKKPIENIVTDVLTSINSARNNTDVRPTTPTPTTPKTPPTFGTSTTVKTTKATTKKAATKPSKTTPTKKPSTNALSTSKTTTTKKPTTTPAQIHQNQNKLKTELEQSTKRPSSTPKVELPMIIMLDTDKPSLHYHKKNALNKVNIMGNMQDHATQFRLPGLPVDDEATFPDDVNSGNTWQTHPGGTNDEEESGFEAEGPVASVPIEYTTIRPYVTPPTKKPNSWVPKRPANESTSATRPNEFYDDEIFGYDPYQTFFHGVYVPVVEVGSLTAQQDESEEEESKTTTLRPRRPPLGPNRPHIKNGKPANGDKRKPMPALPDHLHRPRPSHLQYQHGAADDTDPETGLLNAHYEHAGHSYGPDDGDFMSPDKLAIQSRPALPTQVRKNFTDHHDHHVQIQHGGAGAHGHGHGHGQGDGAGAHHDHLHNHLSEQATSERRPTFAPAPKGNPGLEATLTSLDEEKRLFVDVHNRLALRLLGSLTNPASHSASHYGNMVITPFTVTSSLAMLFLGARGQTAQQLDGLLQLDEMLTFNPHMMYHNITESFLSQPNTAAAIIRLLITDKERGDVLEFYKTRVQHFYDARVEEVDYKFAGHLAQSIINQMIRAQIQRHSYEMINHSLPLFGPMSLLTATFFDGQFAGSRDQSVDHMNFIHLAALSQGPVARRLFQIPAFALRGNHRAAYDKDLDATAVEIPYTTRDISLILIMPGKPGEFAFGGVTSLKHRLSLDNWTKLMRGFYPRDSFKVVVPRFRHHSSLNLSHTLSRFGLTDMFEPTLAKFKGINGLADLHLDQNMMHFSEFGTWEKLSDTLTESNNRNLDLIRILRPHVREHYGHYGEPMSINEWLVKTKNQQRSQAESENIQAPIPDDVSRLRMELERLRRRHPVQNQSNLQTVNMNEHSHQDSRNWFSSNSNPYTSYSKVRGTTTVEFRPRRLRAGVRTQRSNSKIHHFRQEPITTPNEHETVLRFERPFIYILRHNPTGMILITGVYDEPVTEVLH